VASRNLQAQQANSLQWNAQWVNASEDLLALAQGIKRGGSARILLYGPPGSGKTAYVHALARLLDRPLQEQRASDLLSPYVGETEQRISHAFESALNDNAVLFLDEVDSLLANREMAVRNWEVSQVNELLEQLGEYNGVVVLATNRLDALDGAVLRRMDAKIAFEVLNPQQIEQCFAGWCAHLGLKCTQQELHLASQLQGLTPGDFACVARRWAFAPVLSQREALPDTSQDSAAAIALLDLLRQELRLKAGGRQAMGFLAHPMSLAHSQSGGEYDR
jgi:ATP-dependent 26S proteasome regulatory subunit